MMSCPSADYRQHGGRSKVNADHTVHFERRRHGGKKTVAAFGELASQALHERKLLQTPEESS